MNTQTHRIVSSLMVVLMVGLLAAGWFLVAQPQLAAAASSNEQVGSVQSQIVASQASLHQLQSDKGKLPELQAQLSGLQESMPASLASSALVSGIDQEARAAGVFITNIGVADAVAYAPVAAGSSSTTSTPSSGSSPSPTPSASATPGPSQAPAAPASNDFTPKTDPRITAANFVPVPVTITVRGGWDATRAFVKNLQTGPRLYAVGTMHSAVDEQNPGSYDLTVTGYVFSILDPSSQAAAAAKKAAAHPTPTPTAKPTKKPAPTASATPIPSGTPTPSGTPSR